MEHLDPHDPSVIIVASVSGGKDSTAMSLHLTELGIDHVRVFADTGWEHPATLEYVNEVLPKHLGPINVIRNDKGFEELCLSKGMFPWRLTRFCTELLKVKPILMFIEELRAEDRCVNAVGIRHGESKARSKLGEWEFNESMDLWVWRPMVEWSIDDVIAIHKRHGVPPNPLYTWGAARVGCWPCIFSRKSEIKLVSLIDPGRIDRIRDLELRVQEAARKRYAKRGETFESLGYHPPTFFQPLKTHEMMSIDKVVMWASTSYGGKQLEMFFDAETDGCARWGLCDTQTMCSF